MNSRMGQRAHTIRAGAPAIGYFWRAKTRTRGPIAPLRLGKRRVRKEQIACAICCTWAGFGLLTALCCCGAVFAQEAPPPQQQQPPNALAAAPAQEQIQQNATSTCVQPPPLVSWHDYEGPFKKVVVVFGRRLERKAVHPSYK